MAEKIKTSPIEAVYWYKISPKSGQAEDTIPQASVYKYKWGLKGYPKEVEDENKMQCEVQVGG